MFVESWVMSMLCERKYTQHKFSHKEDKYAPTNEYFAQAPAIYFPLCALLFELCNHCGYIHVGLKYTLSVGQLGHTLS